MTDELMRAETKADAAGGPFISAAEKGSATTNRPRDLSTWMLLPILAFTVAIALLWSHQKLLWFDELLELQTDGVGSAREVIAIQRRMPISLDPVAYHLLTHASTRVLGVTALGVRLPALCGFLLLQVSLFFFARRIAGVTAGLLAAALPVLSGTLLYAVEARPYGVLFGLYGLVLLCYQTATRPAPQSSGAYRGPALSGVALGVALAINTHWFGFLVLIPVALAEAVRIAMRRRLDWLMLGALLAGIAGGAAAVPFYAGASRYGLHYYADGTVNLHTITLCYRVLFLSDKQVGPFAQRVVMTGLVLTVAGAFGLLLRQRRLRRIDLPRHEVVLLLAVVALPFFGFLLAIAKTHTMAIRYVFPAVFGFAAILACAMAPLLRERRAKVIALTGIVAAMLLMGAFHIRREIRHREQVMQDLRVPGPIRQALLAAADPRLYVLNVFPYEAYARYEPDPEVRRRLTLLYSYEKELGLRGRDTNALTADHMRHFTGFPIVSWKEMRRMDRMQGLTPHYLLLTDDAWWDWGRDALAQDSAHVRTLGTALGGTVVEVTFPQSADSGKPDTASSPTAAAGSPAGANR